MCLFRRGLCQIADKDIIVYKVVNSNLTSQYYNFQYEVGKTYSKRWDDDFIDYCEHHPIIGGNSFHSNLSKDDVIWLYGMKSRRIIIADKGQRHLELDTSQILLKCIIPAGTKYFKGTYNEIASEKIIIQEICV